ncbi:MAG TPA: sugar porter family MFS transporter [Solirubrobacterales bacterium]|nr:sugar porter family MFS transporter [Solirubrobacterales bacterium]
MTDREPQSEKSARRAVVLTAAIAGLGGLLFGYDTGIIASAMLFIKGDFGLGNFEQGLVVSAVPIGAAFGALGGGRLADRFGRRTTIMLAAVVFIVGSGASAAAPDTLALALSRLLIGVAIGFASTTAPVYISEMAPPSVRGRLVTFFQLSVTVGILVAYLVGLALEPSEGWRAMLALGALPALLLFVGILRMPRSPRWLVMVGRDYDARATLARIRSGKEEDIELEIKEIEGEISQEPGGWSELRTPLMRAALTVGVGLAILQQITGINTVIYYAPQIVQFTGIDSDSSAILATIGVGIVNVAMTIVAIRLLDRAGRRALLLGGVAVMAISLFLLGVAFAGDDQDTFSSVLAVGSLMTFVAAFAISLGPIFWLINSEIYPLRVRSKAASLGTTANWVFNFIVSLTFLTLIAELGQSGAFWLYAGIGVVTWLFCWKLVPETKGKPLEEIQDEFRARVGES